jgi:fluoroquinolone resistance protein
MSVLKADAAELRNRWTQLANSRDALTSIVDGFERGKLSKDINIFGRHNGFLDLRGLPLSGKVIKNISLDKVDLSFSSLDSVWLERADLKNVILSHVNFVDFKDHENSFYNVHFIMSDFSNAGLGYRSSKYRGCIFDKDKFSKTIFIKAEFDNCLFSKCKLKNIDFNVSSFNSCKFVGKIDDVWFRGKYAFPTDLNKFGPFRKNEMDNVDMSEAKLSWLTFTGGLNLRRIILPSDPTVF